MVLFLLFSEEIYPDDSDIRELWKIKIILVGEKL